MNNLLIPNIDDIINNNKLDLEYNVLKEIEDTIIDLYDKKIKSEIFNNNLLLLYELKLDNNFNIKLYDTIDIFGIFNINRYNLDKKILDNIDNIVFTGSCIRKHLIDYKKFSVKNELFINIINDIDINDLIDNTYTEIADMYYKKYDDCVIYIKKEKFRNPSHVILSNYNLKRIGFYKDKLFVSSMFIADYNKFKETINSQLIDPVFNTHIDIFDVLNHNFINNKTIFDSINKKNYTEFAKQKFTKYDIFQDRLTPIEYAIDLFIKEQNDIIKSQLRLIILDLNEYTYQRPVIFYAYLNNLEEYDSELYDILINSSKSYIFHEIKKDFEYDLNFKNINDINNLILKYYIYKDKSDEFYMYLRYKNTDDKNVRIEQDIFNNIIKYDPKNIIINGIKNNYFSDRTKYKIILWTQNLDYFNLFGDDFNIDCAIAYINEIIDNCFIKSFYFLYKIDNTIINTIDENNNNLLHNINQKNKYQEMITILLKLDDSLLFKKNKSGEIPIIKHIKQQNFNIVEILLKYIIDTNNETIFEIIDNDKNNILHHLCNSKQDVFNVFNISNILDYIKKIVLIKKDIINNQNKNYETPIIISAKNNQEDITYYLKGMNCDLNLCDIYGNTVYHYICLNEMCIGMAIENKENLFGYKPSEYCKISLNYYYFIE
jgi:hypothetical protein